MEPFVFETMGTAVTLRGELEAGARASVRAAFEGFEARFSLYRPESEGSRVARRELRVAEASREFREAYDLAVDWRDATEGAFTPHRPDGVIDLAGIVKALAIARAGDVLRERGLEDWCLNAGGDVLASGVQAGGGPWVVGIVDPGDRVDLLTQFTVDAAHPAVATSGIGERGEHVWRIGADARFVQVTVAAADIVTADVLATAILAGGPGTLELAQRRWDLEVIAAGADGRFWATGAFRA